LIESGGSFDFEIRVARGEAGAGLLGKFGKFHGREFRTCGGENAKDDFKV
jgi:hypothetical protein